MASPQELSEVCHRHCRKQAKKLSGEWTVSKPQVQPSGGQRRLLSRASWSSYNNTQIAHRRLRVCARGASEPDGCTMDKKWGFEYCLLHWNVMSRLSCIDAIETSFGEPVGLMKETQTCHQTALWCQCCKIHYCNIYIHRILFQWMFSHSNENV